jgi:hypothetical protein
MKGRRQSSVHRTKSFTRNNDESEASLERAIDEYLKSGDIREEGKIISLCFEKRDKAALFSNLKRLGFAGTTKTLSAFAKCLYKFISGSDYGKATGKTTKTPIIQENVKTLFSEGVDLLLHLLQACQYEGKAEMVLGGGDDSDKSKKVEAPGRETAAKLNEVFDGI